MCHICIYTYRDMHSAIFTYIQIQVYVSHMCMNSYAYYEYVFTYIHMYYMYMPVCLPHAHTNAFHSIRRDRRRVHLQMVRQHSKLRADGLLGCMRLAHSHQPQSQTCLSCTQPSVNKSKAKLNCIRYLGAQGLAFRDLQTTLDPKLPKP